MEGPRAPASSDVPYTKILMKTTGRPSPDARGNHAGRWTRQEHENFLVGLNQHGREWKKVALYVKTRTPAQIRSHAQKYFAKLERDDPDAQRLSAAKLPGAAATTAATAVHAAATRSLLVQTQAAGASCRRPFSPTTANAEGGSGSDASPQSPRSLMKMAQARPLHPAHGVVPHVGMPGIHAHGAVPPSSSAPEAVAAYVEQLQSIQRRNAQQSQAQAHEQMAAHVAQMLQRQSQSQGQSQTRPAATTAAAPAAGGVAYSHNENRHPLFPDAAPVVAMQPGAGGVRVWAAAQPQPRSRQPPQQQPAAAQVPPLAPAATQSAQAGHVQAQSQLQQLQQLQQLNQLQQQHTRWQLQQLNMHRGMASAAGSQFQQEQQRLQQNQLQVQQLMATLQHRNIGVRMQAPVKKKAAEAGPAASAPAATPRSGQNADEMCAIQMLSGLAVAKQPANAATDQHQAAAPAASAQTDATRGMADVPPGSVATAVAASKADTGSSSSVQSDPDEDVASETAPAAVPASVAVEMRASTPPPCDGSITPTSGASGAARFLQTEQEQRAVSKGRALSPGYSAQQALLQRPKRPRALSPGQVG